MGDYERPPLLWRGMPQVPGIASWSHCQRERRRARKVWLRSPDVNTRIAPPRTEDRKSEWFRQQPPPDLRV